MPRYRPFQQVLTEWRGGRSLSQIQEDIERRAGVRYSRSKLSGLCRGIYLPWPNQARVWATVLGWKEDTMRDLLVKQRTERKTEEVVA